MKVEQKVEDGRVVVTMLVDLDDVRDYMGRCGPLDKAWVARVCLESMGDREYEALLEFCGESNAKIIDALRQASASLRTVRIEEGQPDEGD